MRHLRTSPSSGQAANNSLLRHLRLPACHSGAAFEGSGAAGVVFGNLDKSDRSIGLLSHDYCSNQSSACTPRMRRVVLKEPSLRRDNHYVPHVYLKAWETSPNKLWVYRVLASHHNVPAWNLKSTKGISFLSHLYTRIAAGGESDEMERWFDSEFEAPASEVLKKAITDCRLQQSDWHVLIRFLTLQDVRTPAKLIDFIQQWETRYGGLFQRTIQQSADRIEALTRCESQEHDRDPPLAEYFPMRITTKIEPDQEYGFLDAKIIVGRALWLHQIKHLLCSTADALLEHRWSIMKAPDGIEWFTTDEIFMPLGPKHLLYTQVGSRPPKRGSQFSLDQASIIQRCIAQHSHRYIFASSRHEDVFKYKPRIVNAEIFKEEAAHWNSWHHGQSQAEKLLIIEQ
jgi:hypothetical protein